MRPELKCETCGKTGLKNPRGLRTGHVWCITCYRKRMRTGKKTELKFIPKPMKTVEEVTPKLDIKEFDLQFKKYRENLSEDMRKLIPHSNGFVDENGLIEELARAYMFNFLADEKTEKFNFLIEGDTGTGKTQCAVSFAHKMGLPCYHVTFNGAITPEQLIGFQKLEINKDGIQEQVWQDGVLTKFARKGGVIILDEINACPNEIAFVLFPLLDKLRKLDLLECNGEIIKAHPGFFVIATMNEGYAGTNDLNTALASRFNQPRKMEYSEKVERTLVREGRISNYEIVELAKKQRARYKHGEFTCPISTRDLVIFKISCDILGEKVALNNLCNKFKTETEKKAIVELYELEVRSKQIKGEEKS